MYRALMLAAWIAAPVFCGSIEGRVANSVTGEPVVDATVRFLDQHSYVFQTVTDSSGNYRLTNLQDGDYRGEFSKDGFQDARDFFGPPDHVSGDLSTRQDARMNPFGGLRGRVVDEEGRPAPAVRVELSGGGGASTDENGEFYFKELRPGSYTVVAKPEPVTRVQDGIRLGAVPVYYPSATELADAVPVTVAWGQDVAGITIALKSVRVHRVTGVVLDQAGKPVGHATVKLLGRPAKAKWELIFGAPLFGHDSSATMGPGPEPEVARVESREDGSFEFAAVEQGDWRVSAEAGVDDDRPMEGVVSAAVADKDVEDVRIRLNAPFAVPVTGDTHFLALYPMEAQPHLNIDPATNVGKVNGIFPGRYRVLTFPWDLESYAGGVLLGGVDVLGQEVEFEDGSGPLEIVMKHDTGSLRGTVENGEGASVYLVRRESGQMVHYRQAVCGAGGTFQFNSVEPGDYYLVAFDRVAGRALPVGDLPDSIVPLATGVRIESGSTATVEVRVNPWRD